MGFLNNKHEHKRNTSNSTRNNRQRRGERIMIQANELRIGNIIKNNTDYFIIVGLDKYFIKAYMLNDLQRETLYEFKNYHFEPIPLTEEILLKCGGVKMGVDIDIKNITLWYSTYSKCYVKRYVLIGTDIERKINLKYLHQFQNLYFVLTNKELEITL